MYLDKTGLLEYGWINVVRKCKSDGGINEQEEIKNALAELESWRV